MSRGRESPDEALQIVESYGPWGTDLNDGYRRQIVLAEEVTRLRAEVQEERRLHRLTQLCLFQAQEAAKRLAGMVAGDEAKKPTPWQRRAVGWGKRKADALRWRLHAWADWHQARGQWRAAKALDALALQVFRVQRFTWCITCWWRGCEPDYPHPSLMTGRFAVPCKRCGAPDTSEADRMGDTRENRFNGWAWWWLRRRWWPAKCCGCGRRFGKHDACDPWPF